MARHLKPFGREYVAMNILWYEPAVDDSRYHAFANLDMDEYGRLIPPVGRSPSSATEIGFKALSDLIHDLDLRFGIHILRGIPGQAVHPNPLVVRTSAERETLLIQFPSVLGTQTCTGWMHLRMARRNIDAAWGVDFVKVDDIYFGPTSFNKLFTAVGSMLT